MVDVDNAVGAGLEVAHVTKVALAGSGGTMVAVERVPVQTGAVAALAEVTELVDVHAVEAGRGAGDLSSADAHLGMTQADPFALLHKATHSTGESDNIRPGALEEGQLAADTRLAVADEDLGLAVARAQVAPVRKGGGNERENGELGEEHGGRL